MDAGSIANEQGEQAEWAEHTQALAADAEAAPGGSAPVHPTTAPPPPPYWTTTCAY